MQTRRAVSGRRWEGTKSLSAKILLGQNILGTHSAFLRFTDFLDRTVVGMSWGHFQRHPFVKLLETRRKHHREVRGSTVAMQY